MAVEFLVYEQSRRGGNFSRIDSSLVDHSSSAAHVADQLYVQKLLAPSLSYAAEIELMHRHCAFSFRLPILKLVEGRSRQGLP